MNRENNNENKPVTKASEAKGGSKRISDQPTNEHTFGLFSYEVLEPRTRRGSSCCVSVVGTNEQTIEQTEQNKA